MKTTKWSELLSQALILGIMLFAGMVCGWMMMEYGIHIFSGGPGQRLLVLGLLMLELYLALFVQTALHEAGHLIFGLFTGYRFCSYRLGSLMVFRENGKLRLGRFSLAGTGGQCLMAPPNRPDGRFPVVLYNLGGSLFNLLSALIFWQLWRTFRWSGLLSPLLLFLAVMGLALALVNGIPLRNRLIANDGSNALILVRSQQARRSFWLQLEVHQRQAQGIRLADMPEEWFSPLPPPNDPLSAGFIVMACSRQMDQEDFPSAKQTIQGLMAHPGVLLGLHRQMLICDLIYLNLLDGQQEAALALLTPAQKKFMKSMRVHPSVIRTQYALALLSEKDGKRAAALRESFEKISARYPYPAEITSESRLLELAGQCLRRQCLPEN